MGWDDWVFGILTLGAYNVGKSVYNASNAAAQAGTAAGALADQAGNVLAAAGSQLSKLGNDLSSFLEELQELVTIKRETPRDESELWDEEVARLKALREKETQLLGELETLGAQDVDYSWHDIFWGSITGAFPNFEELEIRSKLAMVRAAIKEILYEEPGVVPTSIYYFKEILEQFSNTGLPRIEETIGSVQDNLEESVGILQEVKKLFVIKTFVPVSIDALPEYGCQKLRELEDQIKTFDGLIKKNVEVASQLRQTLDQVSPSFYKLPKSLAPFGKGGESADYAVHNPVPKSKKSTQIIIGATAFAARPSKPMALRVGSILKRDEVVAYLSNYNATQGLVRFFERERLKIEKAIFRIKFVVHEEPGVIPKTLDEIKQIVQRFRLEEQPRIEVIMDNVNQTIMESKNLLANVNKNTQRATDFLSKYKLLIGITVCGFGGLIFGIMLMVLVVLTKTALGI